MASEQEHSFSRRSFFILLDAVDNLFLFGYIFSCQTADDTVDYLIWRPMLYE